MSVHTASAIVAVHGCTRIGAVDVMALDVTYAKAPILLHAVDEAPTFDLHVRRSCADYL